MLLPRLSAPRAFRSAVALALLLATVSPAAAFEVLFDGTRRLQDHLWADIRITDALPARVEESLGRGMPATLQIHSELWRKRTAWFDRLEDSFDAELRVRYDVWSKEYRIERRGLRPETFDAFEALEAALMRPMAIKVGRLPRLQPGGRYYVVVTATLRPLDVEDAEQVEGWLSGEVDTNRRSGFGVITELPRSLFDAVRNLAGFGDVRARAFSAEIAIEDDD